MLMNIDHGNILNILQKYPPSIYQDENAPYGKRVPKEIANRTELILKNLSKELIVTFFQNLLHDLVQNV